MAIINIKRKNLYLTKQNKTNKKHKSIFRMNLLLAFAMNCNITTFIVKNIVRAPFKKYSTVKRAMHLKVNYFLNLLK